MFKRLLALPLFALLLATVAGEPAAAGGAKAKLLSHWGTRAVRTDITANASAQVVPFSNDSPFTIGLYNDRDFLFVVLRTSDAAMRARMLREGLVVWFDPDGGTKKQFGLQYPSGQRGGGRSGGSGDPRREGDSESMWADAQANGLLSALEVLGPKKDDRLRLVAARTDDPTVRIWSAEGTVTYEIKVPLSESGEHHYAIGTTPGTVIGLGLATPDPLERSERGATGGGRGGGGRGGRGGGGRGGHGGGYGGGQGRGDFQPPKPLKEWTTVQLAAGPGN